MGTHKVHFSVENVGYHGEGQDIAVAQRCGSGDGDDGKLWVHAGYLQAMHHYTVTFLVPAEEATTANELADKNLSSHHDKVRSAPAHPGPDGSLQATVWISTNTDRNFLQEVLVVGPDNRYNIPVEVEALVFGKHEGTPRLSPGVKCIGHETESTDGDST